MGYSGPPGEVSERYGKLEDLLRQTFLLAGEIAEKDEQKRVKSSEPLLGDCVFSRKPFECGSTRSRRHSVAITGVHRLKRCSGDDGDANESVGSSVQEPFNPGALAFSLDAILEGNKSDNDLCCMETSSPSSFPGRLSESPFQKCSSGTLAESLDFINNQNIDFCPSTDPNNPSTSSKHSSLEVRRSEDVLDDRVRSDVVQLEHVARPAKCQCRAGGGCFHCLHGNGNVEHTGSFSFPRFQRKQSPQSVNSSVVPTSPLSASPAPRNEAEEQQIVPNSPEGSLGIPPKWHVRILPISCNPQSKHPPPPQALVKLEAVFPLNISNSMALHSQGSCIIIRQPLQDYVDCGSSKHYESKFRAVHDKSLQDFIDEWQEEADTESPP